MWLQEENVKQKIPGDRLSLEVIAKAKVDFLNGHEDAKEWLFEDNEDADMYFADAGIEKVYARKLWAREKVDPYRVQNCTKHHIKGMSCVELTKINMDKVFKHVGYSPAQTPQELSKKCGFSEMSCRKHLKRLVKLGKVGVVKVKAGKHWVHRYWRTKRLPKTLKYFR